MNSNDYSIIHSLPLEKRYEAIDNFINSKVIDNKSVTHCDIIAIGEKLKQLMSETKLEEMSDQDNNEYLDKEINKLQMKLTIEHKEELERLTGKLNGDKERELNEMKTKYEGLIDRITDVHTQSETTKLNAQKRKFEQELRDKLEQQAAQLEKEKIEAMEKEREEYFDKFCKQFENKIKDAVRMSVEQQQEQFEIEKQKLINRMENIYKIKETRILKELQNKLVNVENLLKSRYRMLFMEYDNALSYHANLEQDYQELQMEFQRFIDSTDGYFHSDYLLKLRSHAIQHCHNNMRMFESTLTEKLFTPDDFDRCKYSSTAFSVTEE